MSVLILTSQTLGPFKSIETLADRLRCDGTDYPFVVIGDYTISEDDSLAPPPPVPPVLVPESVSMRQARLALLGAGLLDTVNAGLATLGQAAQIEWEYASEVRRDSPLVAGMGQMLNMDGAALDALFVQAATL
jgi:hypothetical protein